MERRGVLEAYRDRRVAFARDCCDGQLTKARPGGRRARHREAGVAAAGFLIQQRSKRALPAGAEGGNPERSEQPLAGVPGEVEQRVDVSDGHLLGSRGELDDLVSRLYLALFEHPEVEAGTVVGDEQRGNLRIVHPDPDAIAGDARLRYLEGRAADLVAIADADLVVAQSLHSEVLAELSVHEVVSSELVFPVPIRVDLVDEHCALLAAVPRQIALTIAVDVESADPAGTGHGVLEDPCKDGPPLPGHVLRQADVDRQQRPDGLGGGLGDSTRLGSGSQRSQGRPSGSHGSSKAVVLPRVLLRVAELTADGTRPWLRRYRASRRRVRRPSETDKSVTLG